MHKNQELAQMIVNHFSRNELADVTHDLGVSFEYIAGDTLTAKARDIVQYFYRRDQLVELAKGLAHRKPTIDFSEWGAPLPQENLLAVLRQMLEPIYNLGELKTLAFDLYPNLNGELITKAQSIEVIVEHAVQTNTIHKLLAYVRGGRNHQYHKYISRVNRAAKHYTKEPKSVPVATAKPKAKTQESVSAATLLALRMYANGLQDGGELAREALVLLGVEV